MFRFGLQSTVEGLRDAQMGKSLEGDTVQWDGRYDIEQRWGELTTNCDLQEVDDIRSDPVVPGQLDDAEDEELSQDSIAVTNKNTDGHDGDRISRHVIFEHNGDVKFGFGLIPEDGTSDTLDTDKRDRNFWETIISYDRKEKQVKLCSKVASSCQECKYLEKWTAQ